MVTRERAIGCMVNESASDLHDKRPWVIIHMRNTLADQNGDTGKNKRLQYLFFSVIVTT
ncbi:hypothetical protein D3C80_1711480 [compost metagenome]